MRGNSIQSNAKTNLSSMLIRSLISRLNNIRKPKSARSTCKAVRIEELFR